MLLGMELYMKENRRGLFALTVFLSALSNYYFFVGQVFFLLIYWLIRMLSGDWECTLGKFLWLGFEAVIGTAMAGVILLPSYLAVIQNNRTGDILAGWDALIYTKPQRLFDIIHSFFFPQDIPARPNFSPTRTTSGPPCPPGCRFSVAAALSPISSPASTATGCGVC